MEFIYIGIKAIKNDAILKKKYSLLDKTAFTFSLSFVLWAKWAYRDIPEQHKKEKLLPLQRSVITFHLQKKFL